MKTLLSLLGFFCTKSTSETLTRTWRSLTLQTCQFIAVLALFVGITCLSTTTQAQTLKAVTLDCGGHLSGFAQADNGRIYAYGDVFGAWSTDDQGVNWKYLNWNIQGLDVAGDKDDIDAGNIVGMGMAVQKDNADVVYYTTNNAIYKSTNGGTTWTRLLADIAWGLQAKDDQRFRGTSHILIRSNNPNEIWFAGPRKNLTGWLWKSNNGGTDWVKAGGTLFDTNKARTLHNISAFANQIWVGSDLGLYASTDGGNNFAQVSTHAKVGMIQRFATGPYAGVGLITRDQIDGDGGGVSRITATDFNNTSTYTTTGSIRNNIYFGYPTGLQIFSDNTVCAWNTSAERQGYSTDGGVSFTVRGTTLNTTNVPVWTTAAIMTGKNHPDYGTDQVIQIGTDPNKWIITGGGAAMFSIDKGLSWSYFPNATGIAGVKTYVPSVSRYDANRMYLPASDIGSAIVTDGGASGNAAFSSTKTNQYLHNMFRIMEGPDVNNLVIAGLRQESDMNTDKPLILKSSDGGANWTVASTGNLPIVSGAGITKSVMSINDANDFLVVLGEKGPAQRVYRTTNGGTSYSTVTGLPDNLLTGFRYGPQSCYIERDATKPNVRYFASRDKPLYKSTDGGSNWSVITDPFPKPDGGYYYTWGLHADPIRTDNLWAAGDFGGVKVSRNGGQSWTPTAQFFDARFVSSCDGKVAIWGKKDGGSNPNLLWFSNDDGATWTVQSTVEKNFHAIQGITVDRNGKIWVSWNSCTVVTPVTGTTIADTQAPTVPTSLSSSNITSTSFTLNWTSSTDNVGVSTYEIFRGGTSQGTVTGTSYNATGLTPSTAYSFTVRATDAANNNSAQSSALSVTTTAPAADTQAPTVPSGLSSSNVTSTSLTLSWTASTDNTAVTGYEVFRGGVSQGTVTTTFYNATGLTASTGYSFTVRATDASANNSAQSTALSVTTSAVAVTFPVITSRGENLPNEGKAKAFDSDNNTKWLDFSATSFLQIQYASASAFNQYIMVSGNDAPERDPKNWTIEGSTNGTDWTLLNTQTNQTWTARNQARTFTFSNTIPYSYYRINITANGSGSIIQLSELTYSTTTTSTVTGSGNVTLETWSNINGTTIATIPTSTNPTSTSTLTSLETTSNTADNYGIRIRGYIISSTTGSYTFYIASDDNGRFSLSTNDQPSNLVSGIATVNDWTSAREWNKYTTQKSAAQNLTAGTKYYFEALMKEGGGGDNFAIGWTGPGITAITVIGAANLDMLVTTPVSVTGVGVSPSTAIIAVGATQTLTGSVTPSTASQSVTWLSSNTSVATVSTSGIVTGVAAGTSTITATSVADNTKSQTATITVTAAPVSVTGVGLTPSTASIAVGATQTLTASVTPSNANQSVTWSSSNTSVATVSTSGVVTGVAAGTSTITATSVADNTKSQTAAITVTAASTTAGRYEAETATKAGGVANATNYVNYSGTGYVTGFQSNGASVQFAVNVATAGAYNVRLHFGNAAGPGYPVSVYVNGSKVATVQLPSNSSWTTWQNVTQSLTLNSGANTIKFQKDPENNGGAYNLDYIIIPETPGAFAAMWNKNSEILTTESKALNIGIYPNPATNSFNVSTASDNAKIMVTSLEGKVIKTINANSKLTIIDSSNWSAGVYIIQVQEAGNSKISKVLITK